MRQEWGSGMLGLVLSTLTHSLYLSVSLSLSHARARTHTHKHTHRTMGFNKFTGSVEALGRLTKLGFLYVRVFFVGGLCVGMTRVRVRVKVRLRNLYVTVFFVGGLCVGMTRVRVRVRVRSLTLTLNRRFGLCVLAYTHCPHPTHRNRRS